MIESTKRFILELIHAADNPDRITKPEKAYLLREAAAYLKRLKNQTHLFDEPANNAGFRDPIHDLLETARLIDTFDNIDIAKELIGAAGSLQAALNLLEDQIKY